MDNNETDNPAIDIAPVIENQYQEFIDHACDIIFTISINGIIISVNRIFEKITSMQVNDWIGKQFVGLLHTEDVLLVTNSFAGVLNGSFSDAFEIRIINTSGDCIYLEILASPIIKQNVTTGIIAVCRNVTELKRENAVRMARARLIKFAHTHFLDELIEESLNEVEQLTSSKISFCHFVDLDQNELTLQNWSTRTKNKFCKAEGKGLHYSLDKAGVWVDCIREGKPVIHNNYDTLQHKKGLPEGHAEIIRVLLIPVYRNNKPIAIIGVGNKAGNYTQQDVDITALFAEQIWDITERKQAQDALKESEGNFKAIFDNATSATLIVDQNTTIVMVNEEFCKTSGYTKQELIGTSWKQIINPADVERMIANSRIRQTNPKDVPDKDESNVINKNGEIRNIIMSYAILNNGNIIVSVADITNQKTAENQLRKLSLAVEQSPASIVITDLQGKIEYVNPKFSKVTGYAFEESIGSNPRILKSGEKPEFEYKKLWDTIIAGNEWSGEFHNKKKNGELYWEAASISPVRNENNVITNFVAVKEDITERKSAEHALIKSEEKFSKAFNASPIIITITSMEDGKIVEANDVFVKTTGYSKDEVIGRTTDELNLWYNQVEKSNYIKSLIDKGFLRNIEVKFRMRSGEIRDCLVSNEIIELDGKKCFLNLIVDYTERKLAEDALKKSEEKFAFAFKASPIAFTIISIKDDKFLEVNDTFLKTTGYQREEVIGQTIHDIDFGVSLIEKQKYFNELKLKGSLRNYEIDYKIRNGEVRNFLQSNEIIELEGNPCTVNFYQDITERKKNELAIRQKDELSRIILQTALDGFWLLDKNGVILQANDAYCRMSGFRKAELIGMHISDLEVNESINDTELNVKRVLQKGEDRFETKHKNKNGNFYDVEVSAQYLTIDGGMFVAFIRNITERKIGERLQKEYEENLKKHINELQYKNTQLNDFCNIVSHNLRGPLVNIDMLVDFMEKCNSETERSDLVEKMKTVINQLNETFNELIESLQVKQDLEIVSEKIILSECINKVLEGLMTEINATKAELILDLFEAPTIFYPTKYINSILHNFVSNALKYKSPNKNPVITIKTKKLNNSVILSVTDNGLGLDLIMHQKNLFKIRKVFHKHPDAKGFGLFMTKTQIEAMNGKIWVESAPGMGATFFVEFINQPNEDN